LRLDIVAPFYRTPRPIAIAARPVALGERGVGDDLRLISPAPRAAAGLLLRDFYFRPGRELRRRFPDRRRIIWTYERRPKWWEIETF
jgi:hypothetical protein